MTPRLILQLERLAVAGIQILPIPELATHFVFEREDCVVLVERRGEGFGAIGSPGLLIAGGFAALVTRDGKDWFVGKGESRAAAGAEASSARRLYRDLRDILG
ncbi:MAG: hypothetical protein ABSC08_08785 [Bryobacteraceae bacterium]